MSNTIWFTVFIFVLIAVMFFIGIRSLNRGYVVLGFVGIIMAIIYAAYGWKNEICHDCFAYVGDDVYCVNCGKQNENARTLITCPDCDIEIDNNYCSNCGISRKELEEPFSSVCTECKTELSENAKFCSQCGTERKIY